MSRKLQIVVLTIFLTGCSGNFTDTKKTVPVITVVKCPLIAPRQICKQYTRLPATTLNELKNQVLELELELEQCRRETELWRQLWENC